MRLFSRCLVLPAVSVLAGTASAQEERTLPDVRVIEQAPLPGFGIPRAPYPGNAQQAGEAERRNSGATDRDLHLSRER